MCMEDIRVMRKTGRNESIVAVGAAIGPLVGQDNGRVALIMQNVGANPVTITSNPQGTFGNGFTLPVGDAPMMMDIQKFGNLLTVALFAVCGAALTGSVAVWTAMLEEK